MIIVEGPDGAGKTTFVRELSREFGLKIHPKGERVEGPDGPPKQHERERVWSAIGQMVTGNRPVEIYDRLFFSELVYGPVWRGGVDLSPDEVRLVDNTLSIYRVPVIFCLPPLGQCRDNSRDSTHPKVLPTLEEVYAGYEVFYESAVSRGKSHYWTYDYTREDPVQRNFILSDISRYLTEKGARTWGT